MSVHIFLYRLKCLLRDKETIFWTLLFPLVLAVFFKLVLGNVDRGEIFQVIDLAVVDNAAYRNDRFFQQVLAEVSSGDDRLFNVTVTTAEQAEQLLQNNEVAGYLVVAKQPRLVVSRSGFAQNIIKSFLDIFLQSATAAEDILQHNPAYAAQLFQELAERRHYVREVSGTAAEPDTVLNYFYTLIAMACFYGGFLGMREITDIEANISPLAARINISPVHKLKAFLSSLSASLLIHLAEMFILLLFLRFALQIAFGEKSFYVVLTTVLGSVAGVSFGALVSAMVKKGENIKVAIMLGVTMTGSFLAGMMFQNMKYIIARHLPVLSYLNPVNLLTDAYYSLYYYDTYSRYALNMGILGIFIIIFCTGTYLIIRRRKYASL
ncbi:MAG: ABC transporter permease [Firmicutes bacterium]|jgi:ABC-2 type transport system permease protein|nr:ABC transporter permease [Bacillota bacterium]